MDWSISYRTKTIEIPSDSELRAEAELICQPHTEPRPIVLILHGFRTHMEWGFFPVVARELVKAGAHTIRLNPRFNGYRRDECGTLSFDEDIFAQNTISAELQDVSSILDVILAHSVLPPQANWDGRICLLGHSRGAGLALLAARRFPQISSIVLWSPISRFDRSTERQKERWRHDGVLRIAQSSSGQAYHLNLTFLQDLEAHAEDFDLLAAAKDLTINVHIVVGAQDMVTGPREAMQLMSLRADVESTCTILPRCNHQFNCEDPCEEPTECLKAAIQQTCRSFALQPMVF